MNIVSFGGGVQSTAIALLILEGTLPRPDVFLFADTGDEPIKVYEHVERWCEILTSNGFKFETIKRPGLGLSDHVLTRIADNKKSINYPPLYVERQQEGRTGRMPLWRGCTLAFKSRVLDKRSKQIAEIPRGYKGPPIVNKWIGISLDEQSRTRISQEQWYRFRYPLIELRMTRADCIAVLKRHNEKAPRSACVFCPFHSNAEWRNIRQNPHDWRKAIQFERSLHQLWDEKNGFGGLKSKPTLHVSGLPLEKAPIDSDQIELFSNWDNECFGMCKT